MEDDEDDFYASNAQDQQYEYGAQQAHERDGKMDLSDNQDEDEEEDSDDDVQFTLEKPEGAKSESAATSRTTRQQAASQDRKASSDTKPARSGTPLLQEQNGGSSQPAAVKGTLTHDGKEGKDFPEIRTSKLDVNATPAWPANGKPITEVDIDADLAENSKPWRLPGTDQTDFFNYGFDEYTWAQYCVRQKTMADSITKHKEEDAAMQAQMKAMFGGGGNAPGGPPGMPPMPGMAGMPSPEEMFQQMMAAGIDPTNQEAFMNFMMNAGGGMGGGQGQQNQQQGYGQQGGGGFGGSNSPHPHAGHGFQPPQGPGGQGDQSGFGGNIEGYSPQQLAIMQQQQGQQGGRGRGRGRGRW